ncbi:hypothetical protein [Desulfovibrio cuneatus]|uniref:hypothetical protein n=1 Tax=Desulfovibrio cuneatus TaxID=159728 RepID=UPI0012ECBA93|nr:hypothetical protein [Desulfovibrio cuneatus]
MTIKSAPAKAKKSQKATTSTKASSARQRTKTTAKASTKPSKSTRSAKPTRAVPAEAASLAALNDTDDDDIPLAEIIPLASNAGQLSRVSFGKTVQAIQYANNQWLLPEKTRAEVAEIVAGLTPQFVTGSIRLEPGQPVASVTISAWHNLRNVVRKANPAAGFDVVVDLRRYSTPEAVTQHLRESAGKLTAEAWTFDAVSTVFEAKPAIFRAALEEARRQGRLVGGIVYGGSIPQGLDYVMLSTGARAEGLNRGTPAASRVVTMRAPGGGPLPIIALSGTGTAPGEGFVMGKTPAERRQLVLLAARAQKKDSAFAYPVFGPLAMSNRAYDASRDEFMLDTIRRCLRMYNGGNVGGTITR